MSILLYGCTTSTLTKRLEKKLDGNYTRMLQAISNKSWQQHTTRHQLYGHLPPITKTIQVRRTKHAGHSWRSRDELISDVFLWTPKYGRAKAGRPARTYIQQLCEDTGCSPEDLPEVMNDREKWRERLRDIHASSTTWWFYIYIIYIYIYIYKLNWLFLLTVLDKKVKGFILLKKNDYQYSSLASIKKEDLICKHKNTKKRKMYVTYLRVAFFSFCLWIGVGCNVLWPMNVNVSNTLAGFLILRTNFLNVSTSSDPTSSSKTIFINYKKDGNEKYILQICKKILFH